MAFRKQFYFCRTVKRLCAFLSFLLVFVCSFTIVCAQFHQVHIEPDVDHALKLSFYAPNEGYVAFNKYIGYTTDSGKTFTQKLITNSNVDYSGNPVNLTFGFNINGVKAFSKNAILVYGDYGFQPTILLSSDGGSTFKIVFFIAADLSSSTPTITDLVFPQNDNTGYAYYSNKLVKSADGGQTWASNLVTDNGYINAIQFIDDNNGFCYGSIGSYQKTTDGGTTWVHANEPAGTFNSGYFLNSLKGWVCNIDGSVYMTQDGGANWAQQNTSPLPGIKLSKMQFVNDSTGYAIAPGFDIYKTSNSGKIWERLPRNVTYHYLGYSLNDFQMMNNFIWAAGGHGYIALSNNNGGPTVPEALFTVDTTGFSKTGNISLLNHSKSGYKYNWYVDGKAISNTYNAVYSHDIYHLTDTISLVTTNFGFKDTLTQYAYFNPPVVISSFSPASAAAGSTVTITGINFNEVSSIYFGGVVASSFTVVSPTSITAVVGKGASGKVTVNTLLGSGSKDGFVFIPAPTITSFSPQSAVAGTSITINGTNFNGVTDVSFGGISAKSFSVISSTQIVAVLGKGNSGLVTVTANGGPGSADGFTIIPAISSISPASGTQGTIVNIRGTGLGQASSVSIGGVPVTSFVIDSLTSVTAIVGNGASGDVVVNTPGGNGTFTAFTYYVPPVITSFSPIAGPAGSVVTIKGQNFSTVLAENNVFFGAAKAKVLTATNTTITVNVPVGATYSPLTVQTHHLLAYANSPFTITFANGGGFGPSSFTPTAGITLASFGGGPPVIADIDGDGKPDIFSRNQSSSVNGFSVQVNTGTAGNVSYTQQDISNINAGAWYLADMDGDGLPDLLTTDNTTYNIIVYRNLSTPGKVAFGQSVAMAPVYFSFYDISISAADIDGDGKPDIILTNADPNNGVALYRNKSEVGNLAFYDGTGMAVGAGNSIVFADFDGDGKLDILVPFNKLDQQAHVLRNTSTVGNFSFAQTGGIAPRLTGPISLADIDGDGKVDMVTVESGSNNMGIYRNLSTAGNISFALESLFPVGAQPLNLSVADMDGDGKPDVAVNCSGTGQISIFKNLASVGNLTFSPPYNYINGSTGFDGIAIGDINNDGKNDLLYSLSGQIIEAQLNNVKPSPVITSFSPTHGIAGTVITISGVNFTDVNAVSFGGVPAQSFTVNSDQTIKATVGNGASGNVSVTNTFDTALLPNFAFGQPPVIQSFSPSSGVAGTSVTINGNFFDTTPTNNIVYFGKVRANVTSATASQITVTAPAAATFQPVSVATHNFIAYSTLPFNLTFPGGDTSFNAYSFTQKFSMPGTLAESADLDGDSYPDLIFLSTTGELTIAHNLGLKDSVAFAANQIIDQGLQLRRIYLADINADGKLDIIVVSSNTAMISVYKNTSSGGVISFDPAYVLLQPQQSLVYIAPINLAITDIDGDGLPDIAATNSTFKLVSVYHNLSTGGSIAFAPNVDYTINDYTADVALTDMDGDGKPDMIVASDVEDNVTVLKNTSTPGTISFTPNIPAIGDDYPAYISIADFDGDGKPDAVIANVINATNIAFDLNTSSAGSISFSSTVKGKNIAPGMMTIADLNGDGKPDYLLNDINKNTLNIYKNSSNPGSIQFKDQNDYFMQGLAGFTSVADMDQDGKPDIIQSSNGTINIFRNISKKQLNLADTNFKVQFTGTSCIGSKDGSIVISAAQSLRYTATTTGPAGFNVIDTFTNKLTLGNLDTGYYNACITVKDHPEFQQCYSAAIGQPASLSTFALVDQQAQKVSLQMSGGQNYTITLNDIVYQTSQSDFTLPLKKGNNLLSVTTGKECQGIFLQRITIGNEITIYPNPFVGPVNVDVGESQAISGNVSVVDLSGKEVFRDDLLNNFGKLNMDLSKLNAGVYVVKLNMDNKQSVFKIWKK